jgi:DNA mismatch endonuclease (patch repair protein)
MQSNKGRDTKPELAVRRLLHAAGLRYRVNYPVLPRRTADVVFTKAHVVVFIDGCFWHGCAEHYQRPASHVAYWDAKVALNTARDVDTNERLAAAGWTVLRFWEHQTPAEIAAAIIQRVR